MAARSPLLSRLYFAWILVLGAMVVVVPFRGQMGTVNFYHLSAFTLYFSSKAAMLLLLTRDEWLRLTWGRLFAFLLWWGMNIEPFLKGGEPARSPRVSPWLTGLQNLAVAAILLWGVPHVLPDDTPLTVRLLIGMVGHAMWFIFGIADLLCAVYRLCGFPVEKLFDNPPEAVSLAEFWSLRWNRIFSTFARKLFFRPLAPRFGTLFASWIVFLFAGLVHEWAWSNPSAGGYGGPMAYFLIQWSALLMEHSRPGRRLLRGTLLGRLWTWFVVLAPTPLLIHQPMLEHVVLDNLRSMNVPGLPSP